MNDVEQRLDDKISCLKKYYDILDDLIKDGNNNNYYISERKQTEENLNTLLTIKYGVDTFYIRGGLDLS